MHTQQLSYAGKLCLAPMVRSGELPTRIMALKYGADLVWSPEVIDRKIRMCTRVENTALGTIDFIETDKAGAQKSVVFRTNRALEKGKLIFQLGSSDPDIAVEGASKVINDVDGIDLNCGCPKPFSTHAGMGAALLSTPDLLVSILENLVEKVGKPHGKPVSAKIRLLSSKDIQPTLDLAERICKAGVANLTVHCRTRDMRNRQQPIRDFVNQIHEVVAKHKVSLVINGAFLCKQDFQKFQRSIGNFEIGGMMAEAAESNPTIFADEPLAWNAVLPEFIQTCIDCDNHPSNTKYIMLNQLPGKSKFYQQLCKLKTHAEFMEVAKRIGDEGSKVFVRVMQKDKQYEAADFSTMFNESKRVAEQPAPEKRSKTACA